MSAAASSSSSFGKKRKTSKFRVMGKKRRTGLSAILNTARAIDSKRTEAKAVDVTNAIAINTTATAGLLNGMTIGANAYQRLGRKTSNIALKFSGYIYQSQVGATPAVDYLRVALVYDKQPDGATPSWGAVFTNVDQAGAVTTSSLANKNLDNKDRFVILRDMRYKTEVPGAATVGQGVQVASAQTEAKWIFNEYIKLKGIPSQFSATSNAGTVADIQTGAIFVMTCGVQSAANAQYSVQYASRVVYTDQ